MLNTAMNKPRYWSILLSNFGPRKYHIETPDEGYRHLCASIIESAIFNWQWGFGYAELKEFFASEWFELLAEYCGCDPDFIRDNIKYQWKIARTS